MKSLEDEGESDVDAEGQKAREPPAGRGAGYEKRGPSSPSEQDA